jgi:predicted RNA binding protein YcfA (HicA-like mRNA interferase family)
MSKISPIPAKRLRRVFEKAGFKCVRTKGDHFVYTREGVIRPIIIPDWQEVPVFIIKNNLRTAGMSREEYFALLETGDDA